MSKRQRSGDDDDHRDYKRDRKNEENSEEELERQLKKLSDKVEERKKKAGVSELLTTDDYFKKNAEFRAWLLQSKKKYFDELNTKKCQHYFKKFVKRGKLPAEYYKEGGIQSLSKERTNHKWNFKGSDHHVIDHDEVIDFRRDEANIKRSRNNQDPRAPNTSDTNRDIMNREDDLKRRKVQDKLYNKRRESDLEELVPKPDPGSFKAKLEKKRAAHVRRDDLDDEYGVSDDLINDVDNEKAFFIQSMNKQNNAKMRKQEELQKKLADYQAREDATMEEFKKQMGLSNRFTSQSTE
ncbi:gatB [Acrasis kona]|uniref:Aspartyl/glutamyl-tRNA amidotransferase subunit B n=1 Tax=Acrasis kona TaxID=1008807 RepID=A0AAW2YR31_9EUKA